MVDSGLTAAALLLFVLLGARLWEYAWTSWKGRLAFCLPDEDIRIVTGTPSASLRAFPDMGESVAKEFRRHKENGNIFMANRLGEELAKPLLRGDAEMFDGLGEENREPLCFLYALAVRSAVAKRIDNSILADTVLHSFSETIENTDEGIYRSINDNVADTIYRLCLADNQGVGNGFAKLCGKDRDSYFIELGNEAYRRFWDFSSGKIERIPFK
ncbi:MAG: hypothetical protein HFG26_02270 [Provencibacterium sp.]|jgi:hypothetical protein|nr:hypothetical protein [Provencibacterium sp.]